MFLNGDILLYHCGWSCPTTKGHQNQLSKKNQFFLHLRVVWSKGKTIRDIYELFREKFQLNKKKKTEWKIEKGIGPI